MQTRRSAQNSQNNMNQNQLANLKRVAIEGNGNAPRQKRAALGDVTNAIQNVLIDSSKKQTVVKSSIGRTQSQTSTAATHTAPVPRVTVAQLERNVSQPEQCSTSSSTTVTRRSQRVSVLAAACVSAEEAVATCAEYDYDAQLLGDVFSAPNYARDIFRYYKHRQTEFVPLDYLGKDRLSGCDLTVFMRAILVDWMVEIQENFELNHETLYQAVKMTDLYMSRVPVNKEHAQLVGSCALFISSKFDERQPPCADDFLYICDDAYTREELLEMELKMLRVLGFDIGMPLSYRFVRRYAKATHTTMELLTLARFILECSLMHYEFVRETDSLMAAAAFALALRIDQPNTSTTQLWTWKHIKYSTYSYEQVQPLVTRLNAMLLQAPNAKLKTIKQKYSHEIFYSVATQAPLALEK